MSLALSSSDVHRLEAALATLLSPLAHETADAWGAAVLRDVRALLAADQGYFHSPRRRSLATAQRRARR